MPSCWEGLAERDCSPWNQVITPSEHSHLKGQKLALAQEEGDALCWVQDPWHTDPAVQIVCQAAPS